MQPVGSAGAPPPDSRPIETRGRANAGADTPLTSTQHAALERLATAVATLAGTKIADQWAALRHDLGIAEDADIPARLFPAAEQQLQNRLTEAQTTLPARQLLQQIAELLPQGDNRQLASDFLRQQFGHSVLSELSYPQLQQVFTLLQPAPAAPEPMLSSAAGQNLNQQMARLGELTGQPSANVWRALGLNPGEPIPARHLPLLNDFLQTQTALSQPHAAPTLLALQATLQHPLHPQEQRLLQDYAQSQFNAAPQTPLTAPQLNELMTLLFSRRLRPDGDGALSPAFLPLVGPFAAFIPQDWRQVFTRPLTLVILCLLTAILLLWLVM